MRHAAAWDPELEYERRPGEMREEEERVLRLQPRPQAPTPTPVVLVVDDDLFVCRAVACILTEARAVRVYAAGSGEEALALAPQLVPDLIIMDIRMPGPPVAEICRTLRQMPCLQHTRICVLTGVLVEAELLAELRPLVDEIMTKPPNPRALIALLDAA